MKELNLGHIKIPINAATKTFAILAKRGAGKTYTAGVLAEEFYDAKIPFIVFDPIDVWWGLRFKKDGKEKGLPVVVFGLEHYDIKLDRDMGRRIAQEVVKENISCVISTFGLPKVAQRHLIAEFSEELLNINNSPRHIFIEEAHEFVPQRVNSGIGKCFSAVEALVIMGRNRGIGVTLINQRAATINKDVLTQLDTLIALRSVGPQDRKALMDWVEQHAAKGDFDKFINSLPSLPTGEAWIWSPEFMGIFERFKVRPRETFHPDREKIGHDFTMPDLDQVDIQGFIQRFNLLKSQKQEKISGEIIESTSKPSVDVVALRNQYESVIMQKDMEIRQLNQIIEAARRALNISTKTAVSSPTGFSSSIDLWSKKLGSGLAGRIFKLMAENCSKKFTRQQICLAVGVRAGAGHTNNEFGKLTRNRLLIRQGNEYQLNPDL